MWDAFNDGVTSAGLQIVLTNILNKTQSSFKQVVSDGSVQGDPLFLFKKGTEKKYASQLTDEDVLCSLLVDHITDKDFNKRTCFSRYVNRCMMLGVNIKMDAKQVYKFYDSQKRTK